MTPKTFPDLTDDRAPRLEMSELFIEDITAREAFLNQLMAKLLHGRSFSPLDLYAPLEVNGVLLGNGAFVLSVIDPVGLDSPSPIRSIRQLYSILREDLSRELSRHSINYIFEVDGLLVAISCYARVTELSGEHSVLEKLCCEALSCVVKRASSAYSIAVSAYVSRLFTGVEHIHDAFAELQQRQTLDRFLGRTALAETASSDIRHSAGELAAAARDGKRLAALLQAQGRDVFFSVGTSLLDGLLSAPAGGLDTLRQRLDRFFLSFSDELSLSVKLPPELMDELCALPLCSDAAELKKDFSVCLRTIAELGAPLSPAPDSRIHSILAYISEHLTDPSLSAEQTAERFGLSAPQFSTVFRQGTGRRFVEYLRELRVCEAERLLAETSSPIDQISRLAGFGSVASMYRAFVSLRGVSPSKLRQGEPGDDD